MRMHRGHIQLSRLAKVGLIALVMYFSQVYPYVHFHHAHEATEAHADVGAHYVESEPYHAHHGHDHGHSHQHDAGSSNHGTDDSHHHHHEFDQHVDWHLVRTQSNSILSHIDFSYLALQVDVQPAEQPFPNSRRLDSTALPDAVPLHAIDSRGPPALS